MSTRSKPVTRKAKARPIRQSVTIPPKLATEVRRVAKERHLTMSRALVTLAEQGVEAQRTAKRNLASAYDRFMSEQEPGRKNEAGKDLIRAIFGKDAIAEDSVL
jgi:predicted DNA-binding ribbon-helix-helix protein